MYTDSVKIYSDDDEKQQINKCCGGGAIAGDSAVS